MADCFFSFMLVMTGFACCFLWAFAATQQTALTKAFGATPQPMLTQFFLRWRLLFLMLPLPWLFFALYASFRGAASIRQLIAFSSTLLVSLLTIFVLYFIAFALPWFPRYLIGGNAAMYLNPEKIAQTLIAAERDDAAANYRLYLHYEFTTPQHDLAESCLKRAAALGHSKARAEVYLREESVESSK